MVVRVNGLSVEVSQRRTNCVAVTTCDDISIVSDVTPMHLDTCKCLLTRVFVSVFCVVIIDE